MVGWLPNPKGIVSFSPALDDASRPTLGRQAEMNTTLSGEWHLVKEGAHFCVLNPAFLVTAPAIYVEVSGFSRAGIFASLFYGSGLSAARSFGNRIRREDP